MKNHSVKEINSIIIIILFIGHFNSSIAHTRELQIKVMENDGSPAQKSVYLYKVQYTSYNNKYISIYRQANSVGGETWAWTSPNCNLISDVLPDAINTDGASWSPIDSNSDYYIRIDNKYCHIYINYADPYGGDGDFLISYQNGTFSLDQNRRGITWYGNFTWSNYTIKLINNFGGDYADVNNVKGNIILDDTTFSQISYTGTPRTVEGSTFPHYTSGQDLQEVYGFIRKWRTWQNPSSNNITITLSSVQNFPGLTAKYARQYDWVIKNDFGVSGEGGTIQFLSSSHSSPYQTSNIYEDLFYGAQAINTTINSVYYAFDHWE